MFPYPRPTLLATAVLAGLLSAPAAAADAPAQAEPPAAVDLDRIQVSAFLPDTVQVGTFRDMRPLDVPLTSNVITRDVLDAQAASGLFGALRNTAGLTRAQLNGSTYDNLAIRGIVVENRGNYRLNGSLPVINLIDIPLENKQRVEVLKGVSSLYYGLVPPSGIVNLVTKRAEAQPVTELSFTLNDHGAAQAHLDAGRRFGADRAFGARVNLAGGREDIGIDHFDGERSLATAAFDWRVNDRLNFALDLEHYRKDVSEQAAIALPPLRNGRMTLPPVPDSRLNLAGEWQKYDARASNALLRMDLALGEHWTLQADAGKARTERNRYFSQFENYDVASGDGTLRIFVNRDQIWENENQRVDLTGRWSGARIGHEFTLGYTRNLRDQDPRGSVQVRVAQNLYRPVDIAPITVNVPNAHNPSRIDDSGVYAFDRITFGERWQAMLGMRANRYRSRSLTTRYDADESTPSASLLYKPADSVSLYASYLEGLEESGQAPANRANAGEILPPARSKQKEFGAKAEVADGLLLQASLFDIERPSTTVDASNRFVLNGLARYRGLELAASGQLSERLALVASALLLDAEQRNAANPATFGKTPENTPERTASLFAEYRPRLFGGLALSAGAYYVGARPVNNENLASIGGYTTLSLGLRLDTELAGHRTAFQAVLDNATDRDYWSTAGNGLLGVGTPRTLKLMTGIDF